MPRAHDPRNIGTDRLPANVMGGPIPDQGWAAARDAVEDPVGHFIEGLLQQIKDVTGIDLFWLLDWSWTTNTIMDLVRQANDLFSWLQNPIQRPPNLLTRPSFSSPSAIAAADDWWWDAVVSLGTVNGPDGLPKTDPQGSARTTADGQRHALMSNAISEPSAVAADQILTCQLHVLVEDGFTASDDQAIRLEVVPSRKGVLQDAVVIAHCGVPDGDPSDWIAAPAGSKAAFFDVDYQLPTEDVPDTVELRVVVSESAGGDVPVRFDGARVAAAGGFLVVLADLFDAGRQYLTDLWTAIEAWLADMSQWNTFVAAADDAWTTFVKRVKRALRHADADSYVPPSTSGIISDALKNNPWFGWLFQLVDDWLEPVLKIGKACTDFGDACWQAITTFVGDVAAPNAWQTMVSSINTAWDLFIRAVFVSWGATESEADSKAQSVPSPAAATEKALKNNPVIGWVFDLDGLVDAFVDVFKAGWDALFGTSNYNGTFTDAWNALMDKLGWSSAPTKTMGQVGSAVGSNLLSTWVHSITDPIDDFFDTVRAYINQMIQGLHLGYFDSSWTWVPSLTTPTSALPGGTPTMTPGSNHDDAPGISSSADVTIPAAPTGLVAVPWWDLSVSGFPAGTLTYAIAAVASGVEGPATKVSAFAGTLIPPNTNGRVDLAWGAVSGADSYKIYRKVDGTYQATDWHLIASPSSAGTLLSPYHDKTARSGGTVAHPKSDAELAAQIVKDNKTDTETVATNLNDGLSQVGAALNADTDNAGDFAWAADIVGNWHDTASSAHDMGVDNTNTLGIRNNKPLAWGLDNTTESNIPFDPAPDDMGVTTAGVSQVFVFIRCSQTDTKNSIGFQASRFLQWDMPDSLHVSVFKVNFTSQMLEFRGISGNLIDQVSTDSDVIGWVFTSAYATPVDPGDVLAVCITVGGSSGLALYGKYSTKSVENHPTAKLPALAGRTTSTTAPTGDVPFSSFTFSNDYVPYVCVEISNPPPPTYPDKFVTLTSPGTHVIDVPSWATEVDRVGVGAGGGGAGGINGAGSPGEDTTIKVGSSTLTCPKGAGGPGGNTSVAGLAYGEAAGNHSFNGRIYQGGKSCFNAYPGNPPGGGGGGGGAFFGQYGYGGRAGSWRSDTVSVVGGSTITVHVGEGGEPNKFNGQPSYGAAKGGRGAAFLTFRQA